MHSKTVDIKTDLPECKTIAEDQPLIDSPLWWHDKGLSQTATGYGGKLTTRYKIAFNGKKYRVYATCISNCTSLWFTASGKRYLLN